MSIQILARTVFETARISFSTVAESALGRSGNVERYDARLGGWSKRLMKVAEIDLRVEGHANLPPGESFVVMSNHQSHYDVVVLFQVLRRRVRMVASLS